MQWAVTCSILLVRVGESRMHIMLSCYVTGAVSAAAQGIN